MPRRDFTGVDRSHCLSAFEMIRPAIECSVKSGYFKRADGFLIVADPGVLWTPDDASQTILPAKATLFSMGLGNADLWEHNYEMFARKKAFASWMTGKTSRQLVNEFPHLMGEGWTVYGGSTVLHGLPVAYSGVQQHFDEVIAEWMASAVWGLCMDDMQAVLSSGIDLLGNAPTPVLGQNNN